MADINQIEKKLQKNIKKKLSENQIKLLQGVLEELSKGKDLKDYSNPEDSKILKEVGLISTKPYIIVNNVDENSVKNGNRYTKAIAEKYPNKQHEGLPI